MDTTVATLKELKTAIFKDRTGLVYLGIKSSWREEWLMYLTVHENMPPHKATNKELELSYNVVEVTELSGDEMTTIELWIATFLDSFMLGIHQSDDIIYHKTVNALGEGFFYVVINKDKKHVVIIDRAAYIRGHLNSINDKQLKIW